MNTSRKKRDGVEIYFQLERLQTPELLIKVAKAIAHRIRKEIRGGAVALTFKPTHDLMFGGDMEYRWMVSFKSSTEQAAMIKGRIMPHQKKIITWLGAVILEMVGAPRRF